MRQCERAFETLRPAIWLLIATLAVQTPVWAQFGIGKKKGKDGGRKATVDLIAARDAVVPGERLQLGLQFTVKDRWHIYWQNSGDSGMPPRVDWKLPDGFEAGDLQFPVPKRHEAAGGLIVTNILEGDPVLLVDLETPETIDAEKVRLAAHIKYLICEESCIREQADVELTLPVKATGAPPANEKIFKAARSELPGSSSKFVEVSSSIDGGPPNPGDTFALEVRLDIADGYRLVSNQPEKPSLVGVDVFVERVPNVYWDKVEFPEPKRGSVAEHGTIGAYDGTVTVRVPGEIDAEAEGPLDLGGIVVFQPCNGDGHCHEPEAVRFAMGKSSEKERVGTGPQPGDIEGTESEVAATTRPDGKRGMPEGTETTEAAAPVEAGSGSALEDFFRGLGLPGLLLGCFLYGLFINATPCVLPLLSIKVLGFVQQAHESRGRTLLLGLSFGAGVMLFFVILGLLAAQGTNVLQSPVAVIALGAIVLAMSLSMLGVYTLHVPQAATNLDASLQKEGLVTSFGKGSLAPVLGFACTGPLLAGAFGWATQQPPQIAIIAFLTAGLGMASPYMLLGANPNWLSFLPRPGNWMITFERIMGFLLLAMVIWLLHPLIYQIGPVGLEWTLGFLVFVGMACWIWGKIDVSMPPARQWQLRGLAAAIVMISAGLVYGTIYPLGPAMERVAAARSARSETPKDWSDGIPWKPWSPEAVEQTVRAGKPVFVDFTAAYCTQCKANKATATNTDIVRAKMKALGVVPFQADFTGGDKMIFAEMKRFGRPGPPMNLIYKPGDTERPVLLPTVLTKDLLLEQLDVVVPS